MWMSSPLETRNLKLNSCWFLSKGLRLGSFASRWVAFRRPRRSWGVLACWQGLGNLKLRFSCLFLIRCSHNVFSCRSIQFIAISETLYRLTWMKSRMKQLDLGGQQSKTIRVVWSSLSISLVNRWIINKTDFSYKKPPIKTWSRKQKTSRNFSKAAWKLRLNSVVTWMRGFLPVCLEEMASTLAGNSKKAASISSATTNLRNVSTHEAVSGFWTNARTK